MCSLTFWPLTNGYRLGMNRDEQRHRVRGLPPERVRIGERSVLHPSEPGGGTWISLNDRGVAFALLNAYSIPSPVRHDGHFRSRGEVIPALCDATCSREAMEAMERLEHLSLQTTRPFRLFGFFEMGRDVVEWTWDGQELETVRHPTKPSAWHSSGHQEPEARRIRGETVQSYMNDPDAGTSRWLRRVHSSHSPVSGPFSICMHRDDAATVSYTEIEATADGLFLRHHPGPLCETQAWSAPVSLSLASAA